MRNGPRVVFGVGTHLDLDKDRPTPARRISEGGDAFPAASPRPLALPVIVRASGREVPVEDEDGLKAAAGQFFMALLKGLRDVGVFNELPHAANCYLWVSAVGGGFRWPAWADRGLGNMA